MSDAGVEVLQIAYKGMELSSRTIEKIMITALRELVNINNSNEKAPPSLKDIEPIHGVPVENEDIRGITKALKKHGLYDFQVLKTPEKETHLLIFKARDAKTMEHVFKEYLANVHAKLEQGPPPEPVPNQLFPEVEAIKNSGMELPGQITALENLLSKQKEEMESMQKSFDLADSAAKIELLEKQISGTRFELGELRIENQSTKIYYDTKRSLVFTEKDHVVKVTYPDVYGYVLETHTRTGFERLQSLKSFADKHSEIYAEKPPYGELFQDLKYEEYLAEIPAEKSLFQSENDLELKEDHTPQEAFCRWEELVKARTTPEPIPDAAAAPVIPEVEAIRNSGMEPFDQVIALEKEIGLQEAQTIALANQIQHDYTLTMEERDRLIEQRQEMECKTASMWKSHNQLKIQALAQIQQKETKSPVLLSEQEQAPAPVIPEVEAIKNSGMELPEQVSALEKLLEKEVNYNHKYALEIDYSEDPKMKASMRESLKVYQEQVNIISGELEQLKQQAPAQSQLKEAKGPVLLSEQEQTPAPVIPEVEAIKNSGMELPGQIAALEKEIRVQEAQTKAVISTIRQDYTLTTEERDKVIEKRQDMEHKTASMRKSLDELKAAAQIQPEEAKGPVLQREPGKEVYSPTTPVNTPGQTLIEEMEQKANKYNLLLDQTQKIPDFDIDMELER